MMKNSPVKLPEPKNVRVEYEIASAKLERSALSNGARNLISCVPTVEYEVVLLGMTFDRTSMAAGKALDGACVYGCVVGHVGAEDFAEIREFF